MNDADMATVITAFPLDDGRTRDWFTAVYTAHEAEPTDLAAFTERLRQESAGYVDPSDVDLFFEQLRDVATDQMGFVGQLLERGVDELTDTHRALMSGSVLGAAETDVSDGPFDWVPADQADRLSSAWGQDWTDILGEQLDYRWGADWEAHPAEHKAAWLPELVEELLTPAEDIPSQPDAGEPDVPASVPEPAGTEDFSAEEIKAAVDEVISEVPGAESLSEDELRQIRGDVAAALAEESAAPAQ